MKYLFLILVLVHALVHLMGFAKAFDLWQEAPILSPISRLKGMLWLLATLLFIGCIIALFAGHSGWWIIAITAVFLSQFLVVDAWRDARFGTAANIIILLVAGAAWSEYHFEKTYKNDVQEMMKRGSRVVMPVVSAKDLEHLPPPVRHYLVHAGVMGKPRVQNFFIVFDGQMREQGKDWFSFRSEQFNFVNPEARLFFMKAQMIGLTVPGYHEYHDGKASMDVKLFGIISLVSHHEAEMFRTETVTFLNDLCLFAPAALISDKIQWTAYDSLSANLSYTTDHVTVRAKLFFNKDGELVDFISEDRMAVADMKRHQFSTPVSQYRQYHGILLPSYGEAVWHYADGPFTYGKFKVKDVLYNVDN